MILRPQRVLCRKEVEQLTPFGVDLVETGQHLLFRYSRVEAPGEVNLDSAVAITPPHAILRSYSG